MLLIISGIFKKKIYKHYNLIIKLQPSVLLTIFQSILAQEPPSTCDFFAPTKIDGSLIYFQSPNATGNYPANTNCRWSTKTQIGYQIIINCYNVYLPSVSWKQIRSQLKLENKNTIFSQRNADKIDSKYLKLDERIYLIRNVFVDQEVLQEFLLVIWWLLA